MEINKIYNEDCLETMKRMPDNFVDLVVTSPPYDNLRNYEGYVFDFEGISKELFRVVKEGGVVVWVVGDATINGSETGTSFKQALYFKKIGFNLHDSMIYEKGGFSNPSNNRYHQIFEYMFVFSKNKPKTFNPIKDRKNRRRGPWRKRTKRQKSGKLIEFKPRIIINSEYGMRYNIWRFTIGFGNSAKDKIAYQHPAIFPEQLANDHILSWSNENNLVYDPFLGSGTTIKMAKLNNRNYIGSEISKEYCKIAEERLKNIQPELL